jgi:hypothetical protein
MPAERVEALFGAVLVSPRERDTEADEATKVQNVGSVDSGREMGQS